MVLHDAKSHSLAIWVACTGTVFFLQAPLSIAEESLLDGLSRCMSVPDGAARLTCYDALSAEDSAVTPASASVAESAEVVVVDPGDDLGAETLRNARGEKEEKTLSRATVVRCRKDDNSRYIFYFANGQIWRQSDKKRPNYKDCSFEVTVTKDFFGYKMQQDGEKGRIRVKRLK